MSNVAAITLYRAVHVVDDDTARDLIAVAHKAGATNEECAEALRLRDERLALDVTAVQSPPKCKCSHSQWRHVADRTRCTRPGCGCTAYRTGDEGAVMFSEEDTRALAESLDQMRRGEGAVLKPRPTSGGAA